ncbi:MAG TPA: hypothetical protein VLG37_02625 [Candidatus Saccharimonadales bacterium]|nr:hypothetical protein [Candidatus Saccharimonadales bacterium]
MKFDHIERSPTGTRAWLRPKYEGATYKVSYLGKEVGGSLLAATVTLDEAERLEGGDFEVIESSVRAEPDDANSYTVVDSRNFSLDPGEDLPILNGIRAFREVAPDPLSAESV